MIRGLQDILAQIELWDEVKTIVPGEIHWTHTGSRPSLTVQYDTRDGVKCLARSDGKVQEVFIVTSQRESFKQRLADFQSPAA